MTTRLPSHYYLVPMRNVKDGSRKELAIALSPYMIEEAQSCHRNAPPDGWPPRLLSYVMERALDQFKENSGWEPIVNEIERIRSLH